MKKLISLFCALALTGAVFTACTTKTTNTIVKVESGVITSVNVGMGIWKNRVTAGKATQAQVDNVKAAYNTYYNAQLVLKAALEKSIASNNSLDEAALNTANASMVDAKNAVLAIFNQYVK